MNEKLKQARKDKKLTQEQMATLLGYKSKSGYCMIETGRNIPPLKVAIQISAILGKDVKDLFFGLKVHDSRTLTNNKQSATSA